MKVKKTFVKIFLLLILIIIILNILGLIFRFYNPIMGWVLIIVVVILIGLITRKHQKVGGNIIAYGIPILIVAYLLYWNFVPQTSVYELDVGRDWDTDTSRELYLVESSNLGPRQMYDGEYFRELNGIVEVVFSPKAVLRNKTVTIIVEGEGVSIIPPNANFDPSDYEWDYEWDFTKGEMPEELEMKRLDNNKLVKEEDFLSEEGFYFDGKTRLVLPKSSDKFEEGPFSVYVEWTPEKSNESFQQIIGHYNWEILQGDKSVWFQVGRMNDAKESVYSISKKINQSFFNNKHSLLVVYNPDLEHGYIEFSIDAKYVGKKYFNNEIILTDYGNQDLSFGLSKHGFGKSYQGKISKVYFTKETLINELKETNFLIDQNINLIELKGVGKINSLEIKPN